MDWREREADAWAEKILPRARLGGGGPPTTTFGSERAVTPDLTAAILEAQGGEQSLDGNLRSFFEPRFGHNFNQVRVHADSHAARAARMLDAQAFTLGQDVFFAEKALAPQTSSGLHLIAHELSHTLQQDPQAGNQIRRQTIGDEDLFGATIESGRADAMRMDFEYKLGDLAVAWREEMDAKLGLTLDPWAKAALAHLTGSPYTGAEKVAGGHRVWRSAYRDEGKYPATMVCDQLGEVTQQLFRGLDDYGSGLLRHYGYYQENDSVFGAAVPDGSTIPSDYADPRCAPGATLFNIGSPGKGKDLESHAFKLLFEGQNYTSLYDNGVPRSGVFFRDAKRAVKDKVKELRPEVEKTEESDPYVSTQEKHDLMQELVDVMERNFYPDKWITHEYTVLAKVPPADGGEGKLLFLDTFGNEREGGPMLYGTTQPHWSSLKKVQGKGNVCWGFADVLPHRRFEIEASAGADTETEHSETRDLTAQEASQKDQQDDTEGTSLKMPTDQVVMNIVGAHDVYSFEVQLPPGMPQPPAVAFEYALEKLTSIRDFKIWLEFDGSARGGDSLLKELWLESQGEAVWHRPLWMTEKWFQGSVKKEKKAREQFFGKDVRK